MEVIERDKIFFQKQYRAHGKRRCLAQGASLQTDHIAIYSVTVMGPMLHIGKFVPSSRFLLYFIAVMRPAFPHINPVS
jgi:hypothetical protein